MIGAGGAPRDLRFLPVLFSHDERTLVLGTLVTPKQRLLLALDRGLPDRVPVMETAIDWKVVRGPVLALTRRYTDVWGVRKRLGYELMPYTTRHPVQSLEDLRRYRAPDPGRG